MPDITTTFHQCHQNSMIKENPSIWHPITICQQFRTRRIEWKRTMNCEDITSSRRLWMEPLDTPKCTSKDSTTICQQYHSLRSRNELKTYHLTAICRHCLQESVRGQKASITDTTTSLQSSVMKILVPGPKFTPTTTRHLSRWLKLRNRKSRGSTDTCPQLLRQGNEGIVPKKISVTIICLQFRQKNMISWKSKGPITISPSLNLSIWSTNGPRR